MNIRFIAKLLLLIVLMHFSSSKLFAQTWVPERLSSDKPEEKWLQYLHNEASSLMLHDSTCKRAEAFTGKTNTIEGYKTCISVYEEDETGEMDWETWKVYFGELKSDHFYFHTEVVFDTNRSPIQKIEANGADTSKVFEMATAAKLAIQEVDVPDSKFEYEVIVNFYRLNEYSVYLLPKWKEGEPYYLGGEFHFVIDVKEKEIIKWKMLNKRIDVFYPDILNRTKISKSINSVSPYPTSTDILMMYRRKTGPAHITVAKGWYYGITPEIKIGILGQKDELNDKEWFQEWNQSNSF